jgi:RNA polymerase sigma-32 factor
LSLKSYFSDISKYPLLGCKEEQELAERVFTEGDKAASQTLILSNLRLVVKVAVNYHSGYLDLLDLIQEGNMGLIRAAHKYDPYKGPRFSTYAFFWIRAYILRHILNTWGMVKIGTTDSQRKIFFGLSKARKRFYGAGVEPSAEDLARVLNVSEGDIRMMESRLFSSDLPIGVPNGIENCEEISGEHESIEAIVAAKEKRDALQEALSLFRRRLDDRDVFILENRIMAECPLTLKEIGTRFRISRERVRQLELSIRRRLKSHLKQSVWQRRAHKHETAGTERMRLWGDSTARHESARPN